MKKNKGFSYHCTKEQIKAWMKVPDIQKLRWLDEARRFTELASDEKTKEIREKFRRGEI